MEKMSINDAIMKYQKKWIVLSKIEYDGTGTNTKIGEIVAVKDTFAEAFEIHEDLEKDLERNGVCTVVEGFNSDPQIGGLFNGNR